MSLRKPNEAPNTEKVERRPTSIKNSMEPNNTQFFQTGTRKTKTRILSTNVNGIENKIEYVLELIKRENIDITLIQKTHPLHFCLNTFFPVSIFKLKDSVFRSKTYISSCSAHVFKKTNFIKIDNVLVRTLYTSV